MWATVFLLEQYLQNNMCSLTSLSLTRGNLLLCIMIQCQLLGLYNAWHDIFFTKLLNKKMKIPQSEPCQTHCVFFSVQVGSWFHLWQKKTICFWFLAPTPLYMKSFAIVVFACKCNLFCTRVHVHVQCPVYNIHHVDLYFWFGHWCNISCGVAVKVRGHQKKNQVMS